jgi:hypothetical protein
MKITGHAPKLKAPSAQPAKAHLGPAPAKAAPAADGHGTKDTFELTGKVANAPVLAAGTSGFSRASIPGGYRDARGEMKTAIRATPNVVRDHGALFEAIGKDYPNVDPKLALTYATMEGLDPATHSNLDVHQNFREGGMWAAGMCSIQAQDMAGRPLPVGYQPPTNYPYGHRFPPSQDETAKLLIQDQGLNVRCLYSELNDRVRAFQVAHPGQKPSPSQLLMDAAMPGWSNHPTKNYTGYGTGNTYCNRACAIYESYANLMP